ncbi:penicillin-binding protein, transpeptidase domain protein [Clostridium sp. MSTE9]|uniref:peptidoglycan D,D-transpeptidase FtsI family protein n=1 Tax=Clostridium sp. (strain MSTE9) TaxID=1105031 RepID=UPI00026F23B0|nr:penicillin-binding transpeptidase domain-containing protein [Clostridium sp. MSTE9]EJF41770.1 penicillin-binding protein, transpeptidase domain protein [Clostridium sp. MSTE9]
MNRFKGLSRYIFCIVVIMAAFAVYGLRLIDWQIINGAYWLNVSTRTNTSSVKMTAARGEILDRNGNALAVNKTVYAIVFDKSAMTKDTQNKTILQLVSLLQKRGETWVDELPIQVTATGAYEYITSRQSEVDALKKNLFRGNTYVTAEQCILELQRKYECEGYSPNQTRAILSVRYNMELSGFSVSTPYTFATGISSDTVGIISENAQNLPGATVEVTTVRDYPDGTVAPHVLGTLGAISQEEYAEEKKQGNTYSLDNLGGYAYNDSIGKSGVESYFEKYLRGTNGLKVIETTRTGAVASSTVTQAPVAGDSIYLTIDKNLQRVAQVSLANNVKGAQNEGKSGGSKGGADCVAGGAVVLNVKDFSVLAAATFPSYDLNQYNSNPSYVSGLFQDKTKPMYDRALVGSFMPGSSFKPVVASAALQEGVINSSSTVTCHRVYTFWNDYQPTCMGYHGTINVVTALQKSCNIFFYDTGRRLGIDTLDLYAKRFGLGQKTGIEINEGAGVLSSPQVRVAAGGVWNGGDVVQAAIGQADNSFTPLQLATYVSTLVNDGTRLKTHLIGKITDYNRDKVIMQNDPNSPTVVDHVGVSKENLETVKKGMRAVTSVGGTASSFANYGIAVAGKTGTAQVPPHSDNVVFVGFAPYDKPEIAVAVVLEYGAYSKYSTAVARDLFDAYFFGKTVDASGNLVFPEKEESTSSGTSSGTASGTTTSSGTSSGVSSTAG